MKKLVAMAGLCITMVVGGLGTMGTAMATDLDDLTAPESSETTEENIPLEDVLKNNEPEVQIPQGTEPDINNPDDVKEFELPESEPGDVGEFLKGYRPIDNESLNAANQYMSGPMKIFGYIMSGIIILIMAAVFAITAIDLLYIAIPPVRGFLYTPNTSGTGSNMNQNNYQARGSFFGLQWVSDEAVKAAALLGGEAPTQGAQMQYPGGFGGPAMAPQQAQKQARGSVIGKYMRSRIWFLFILGVCMVLLTSSIFMDWGINVGGMIISLLTGWLA